MTDQPTRLTHDEHYDKGVAALEMGEPGLATAHFLGALYRLLRIPERNR